MGRSRFLHCILWVPITKFVKFHLKTLVVTQPNSFVPQFIQSLTSEGHWLLPTNTSPNKRSEENQSIALQVWVCQDLSLTNKTSLGGLNQQPTVSIVKSDHDQSETLHPFGCSNCPFDDHLSICPVQVCIQHYRCSDHHPQTLKSPHQIQRKLHRSPDIARRCRWPILR